MAEVIPLERPGWPPSAVPPDREALLRSAAAHAPIIIFAIDREGRHTLSEGRGLAKLGRRPGEVVGRSVFETYAGEPQVLDAVRQALAGTPVQRLLEVGGRVLDVSYTPVRDGTGAVAQVLGVAHDVTELHERTRALTESEARLRDFAEASSDWLWETDEEHRFAWFNKRYDTLGFDPSLSLGRSRLEFRAGDPADGDWEAHARDLAERRPFRDFVYGFTDQGGRRRVITVSGIPVLGPDGTFRGYRGTARDVTRETEAEERLRASEARFRSLVTNMRDIIFCRGVAGRGPYGYDVAGAELFGADVDRMAGTADPDRRALVGLWYASIHPEDVGPYLQAERRRKESLEPYALDYRITHPVTRDPRWVREVAWAVEDRPAGRVYFDSYIVDITALKRNEQALRESEERYRRLIEGAPVAILIYRKGRCVYANPSARRLLGARDAKALLGRRLLDLPDGPDRERLLRDRVRSLRDGCQASASTELVCRRLDGRTAVVEASMARIREGGAPALQLVLADISARKQAEARVHHMAQHDALTGLPNRLLLLERLERAVAAAREDGWRLALMILDLDGFKEVNDTLGHGAGDALLREVASRLRACIRAGDTLARLGGDEFAIVQPGVASLDDAAGLAARLIEAVARPFVVDGQEVRAGASVGIALFPGQAEDGAGLMQHADLALYRSKDEGRGRFSFFEPGMGEAALGRLRLASELGAALEAGGLAVAFQPIVDLRTGALVGAEALARWPRPEGDVPPATFVPVAEGTGLIRPLGAWVLDRACAEAKVWATPGSPASVAVNVSAVQLRDPAFGDLVAATLDRHGLPPERLCLELTESLLIDPRLDGIGALLERLDRLGVRMAIDDFGTGYSSLLNLKRLPVHHIKIDGSFVRGIGRDPDSEAIVRATLQLARSLGKLVVAEGVETAAQRRYLRRLGCDRVQGYLYAEPQSPEAFRQLALAPLRPRSRRPVSPDPGTGAPPPRPRRARARAPCRPRSSGS